ncbi:MAG: biopolymer transporter ExbD [Pseudomonadota bacterium]
MDFSDGRTRRDRSSVVPMINIVFLLLIFFLLSATVETLPPFEISPPESQAEAPPETPDTLFIGADGTLAFGEVRGDAVFDAIAQSGLDRLLLRADRELPARRIAAILARCGEVGIASIRLVVERG